MVNRFLPALPILILIALLAAPPVVVAAEITLQNVPAQVYFSPGGNQVQAVAKEMENATMEILVQSNSLDSPQIVKALQGGAKRAVSVEVMVDRSKQADKGGTLRALASARIPILVDDAHAVTYNDVIIIDKTTVITGGFALSASGEKNPGNMLIVKSKDIAGFYLDNWLAHKEHARVFPVKGPDKAPKSPAKKKRK